MINVLWSRQSLDFSNFDNYMWVMNWLIQSNIYMDYFCENS